MLIHSIFTRLLLHSDDELEQILGAGLESSRTIHGHLSCVQELLFKDGRWPLFDQWAAEAVRHII